MPKGSATAFNQRLRRDNRPAQSLWRLLVVAVLCLVANPGLSLAHPAPQKKAYKEYEVKAAYLFNFLKFVDWPEEKKQRNAKTVVVATFGKEPYEIVRKILHGKTAQGYTIEVIQLTKQDLEKSGKMLSMDALFLTSAEPANHKKVLSKLKGLSILTVGEDKDFLENGGMINMILVNKKLTFEVNQVQLDCSRLKLRSKMLRLAKRIITESDD